MRNSGRCLASDNSRTDCQVQFIHQPRAEQRIIQFSAPFTNETPDIPLPAQPTQGGRKVNLLGTADSYFICQGAECFETPLSRPASGKNNDRRKTPLKNL